MTRVIGFLSIAMSSYALFTALAIPVAAQPKPVAVAADDKPGKIVAREIVLVDEAGVKRIQLHASANIAGIWIINPADDKDFVTMYSTKKDGSAFALYGPRSAKQTLPELAFTADATGARFQFMGADGGIRTKYFHELAK